MKARMLRWTRARSGIYIIPNRWGLGMLSIIAILFYLSVSINQNLIFFFTFWFASIFIVLLIMGHFNLANLEIFDAKVDDLYSGQNAQLNLSFHSSRMNLHRNIHLEWGTPFFSEQLNPIVSSGPLRRGKFSADRMVIWSDYPMGLFFVWRSFPISGDFYVYPQRSKSLKERSSFSRQGVGNDFKDHTNFQAGHSLSRVNWKFFSRTREMYTKEFEDMDLTKVTIDYGDYSGHHEEILSQLSELVAMAYQNNVPFNLVLPQQSIPYGGGYDHYILCMRALSEA